MLKICTLPKSTSFSNIHITILNSTCFGHYYDLVSISGNIMEVFFNTYLTTTGPSLLTTSGCRSVGIVRSRTQATEFSLVF
jgi:hypothetical protein